MTVYITKFALTEGIIQAEAEYFSGMECIRVKRGSAILPWGIFRQS